MATSFDSIKDLALIIIRDYKLDKLYEKSVDDFQKYTDGMLIKSIPKFVECLQPLDYNTETREFANELTLKEQSILADWFVYTWFETNVNDVTQFNLHLTNTDFKHYAEANNLDAKSEYLDRMREKIKQDSLDYQNENIDKIPDLQLVF
jgi:hypothetical protein